MVSRSSTRIPLPSDLTNSPPSKQGCCQSTEEEPSQPSAAQSTTHTGLPRDSSRAAINQPAHSVSSNLNSSRRSSSAANARPNAPLRAPSPLAKSPKHIVQKPPPWTRAQLESERTAFFESRVTGDAEVWKALGVVCEMLRKGEVAEAQGIVDALGVTCPSGRVASGRGRDRVKGGVYDERGVLYEIPGWVIVDPGDVVEDGEGEEGVREEDKPAALDGSAPTTTTTAETSPEEKPTTSTPPPGGEKGKARLPDIGPLVHIRCRLSDRGTDISVEVGKNQAISVLIRKIQDQVGSKRMRIMYLGKALDERKSVAESGWVEGHVVNAMVFEGDEGMERVVRGQKR